MEVSPNPVAGNVVEGKRPGDGTEVICGHCLCWDLQIGDRFCSWCATKLLWTRETIEVLGGKVDLPGDGPWTTDELEGHIST